MLGVAGSSIVMPENEYDVGKIVIIPSFAHLYMAID